MFFMAYVATGFKEVKSVLMSPKYKLYAVWYQPKMIKIYLSFFLSTLLTEQFTAASSLSDLLPFENLQLRIFNCNSKRQL